jgi:hypothetical protein
LEVYDIANSQITNAAFIGTVGLDWQFSGVGNFSGVPDETDLLLRNSTTGGMEVYNIAKRLPPALPLAAGRTRKASAHCSA